MTDSAVSAASGLGVSAAGDLLVQYVASGSSLRSSAGAVSLSAGGSLTIAGSSVTASSGSVSISDPGNISITAAVDSGGTAHGSCCTAAAAAGT